MEVKEWTYKEYPSFEEPVDGAVRIPTTRDEKGYVIAVVEYRDSDIAPFPAVAVDTRNAIRFMKMHAAEYSVDAEKMFGGGDSSGAHAAMFSQLVQDVGGM